MSNTPPEFSDEQVRWLSENLHLSADLFITPPQDGYGDPLDQVPPTIGVKIKVNIPGRPVVIRKMNLDHTPLGQWGWVLDNVKAQEVRHWATYRYQVPKGKVSNASLTRLVEGKVPEPA